MTTRPAKIIEFPAKQRHIRARLTGKGEFLKVVVRDRTDRGHGDDGPRAA